jgi:uncharacterized protein
MRYLITGGTGLVGRNLIQSLLQDGHSVVNLSRSAKPSTNAQVQHLKWDGKQVPDAVGAVDVVVNLAGASIAGQRWTTAYKALLMSSRVDATHACRDFIRRSAHKPGVFISASGYNYYGTLFDDTKDETAGKGDGFMAEICDQWEKAAQDSGIRTANLRISVVLDPQDGPLAKMMPAYKFFVGGPTGTGKQGFPWIHIADMVRAIRFVADTPAISGPVNLAAPTPTTAQQFSDAVAKALSRPNFFRLSKGVLELIFGELSVVLWGGGFVRPKVLLDHGFTFQHTAIDAALKDLLKA